MYNLNYKNTKKGYFFGGIFLITGLIIFIVMLFLIFGVMINKSKMDSRVEAYHIEENWYTDSEGDKLAKPTYYYNVNGEEYKCQVNISSSRGVKDNQKTVYYDSLDPNKCVTDYTPSPVALMYIVCLIPIIFIIIGARHIIKVNKNIKKMKYLAQYGTLIKGLPYMMEETNLSINGAKLFAISLDYTTPSGIILHLVGEPRYDRRFNDEDNLVDLLIDMNDTSNYYIDFNIERNY